jgi:hypothetical protein
VVAGIGCALVGYAISSIATTIVNGQVGNRPDISGLFWTVSTFSGAFVWFLFFVFGVIVSAQGQQLLATLDAAVHSSPFMDTAAKAQAMSLS